MSKLIAQTFFSLMVSLGLVAGVNPDVRGEVKQAWQETKAIIQQTVDFAAETAADAASQVDTAAAVEIGAEASTEAATDVYLGETSSEAQAETNAQTGASVDAGVDDGFLLNFVGNADTGLKIDLGFWK